MPGSSDARSQPRPSIYLALKCTGGSTFLVESLSANVGDIEGAAGEYNARTPSFRVPDDFVSRYIKVRARVRMVGAPSQVTVYAHSSALKDDPTTSDIDERWRPLATKIVTKTSTTVFLASFDTLEIAP